VVIKCVLCNDISEDIDQFRNHVEITHEDYVMEYLIETWWAKALEDIMGDVGVEE